MVKPSGTIFRDSPVYTKPNCWWYWKPVDDGGMMRATSIITWSCWLTAKRTLSFELSGWWGSAGMYWKKKNPGDRNKNRSTDWHNGVLCSWRPARDCQGWNILVLLNTRWHPSQDPIARAFEPDMGKCILECCIPYNSHCLNCRGAGKARRYFLCNFSGRASVGLRTLGKQSVVLSLPFSHKPS